MSPLSPWGHRSYNRDEPKVLVTEEDFLAADGQQADEFAPTPRLIYSESINLDDVIGP